MPLPLILAGVSTAIGAYNAIAAGRQRKRLMDKMGPYLDLMYQTAKGGGPMIEAAVGGITQAGELGAQRATRAVTAAGPMNKALAMTVGNQARIGARYAAGAAKGQIMAGGISPQLAATFYGSGMDVAGSLMETGGTGIGLGLSRFLEAIDGGGQAPAAPAGPMQAIPSVGFNTQMLPGQYRRRGGTPSWYRQTNWMPGGR